ncbi:hypothetical protein A2U01_0100829, partial [Trifolium medium]|nr:hypothetical protein [Trifolium medium]
MMMMMMLLWRWDSVSAGIDGAKLRS